LLTLQPAPKNSDELIFVVAMQARELWLRVMLRDLAALKDADASETQKLLRRDIEIVKLLELQSDVAETILPRAPIALRGQSQQLARLMRATRALPRDETAREFAARLRAWRTRDAKWIRTSKRGRAYEKYLRVNELLELQNAPKMDWAQVGQQPNALSVPDALCADEVMFVVVHQAFELWFKVLRDLVERSIALIAADDVIEATRLMRRAVAIQKLLAHQIHIPATMTPHDFLTFRSETKSLNGKKMWRGLAPASGTESYQFRELEIASGLNANPTYQEFLRGHADLTTRFFTPAQEKRMAQPSLADAFNQQIARRDIADVIEIFAPHRQADLADLADALLEYDEFFYLWRVNHIVMLQRMIGEKPGTGYLGLGYLKETAGLSVQGVERIFHQVQKRPRFFENLWHARSRFK
jgi:tryptophan 2,3-dioxygenase